MLIQLNVRWIIQKDEVALASRAPENPSESCRGKEIHIHRGGREMLYLHMIC